MSNKLHNLQNVFNSHAWWRARDSPDNSPNFGRKMAQIILFYLGFLLVFNSDLFFFFDCGSRVPVRSFFSRFWFCSSKIRFDNFEIGNSLDNNNNNNSNNYFDFLKRNLIFHQNDLLRSLLCVFLFGFYSLFFFRFSFWLQNTLFSKF